MDEIRKNYSNQYYKENVILRFIRKTCRLICHQKPDRCFKIGNYRMPICARCSGILISFIASLILLSNKIYINWVITLIMFSIMFLDWLLQYKRIKKSTNRRRFITGLIGGIGLSYTYYYIIIFIKTALFKV